jgi:hypothetical protein
VQTATPTSAKLDLRLAMEARDLAAARDAFATDAVVRSPLTGRLAFRGHEEIVAILAVILDVFDDFHYTDELNCGEHAVLVAKSRVGATEIELVDHLRLDQDGKITEMTVFFRPLPAIAVAMRLIGAGLGMRRGRSRAALISALIRPLELFTRVGDRIGVLLIRPTL